MPRSYRFEHFTVPAAAPRSRSMRRQDKQHLADSRHGDSVPEEGVHYGKSHAETEEILHARALAPPRREPSPAPRAEKAVIAQPRINRNTVPIGALPTTEELPPRGRLQDLLDEATRQVEAIQNGVGDVSRAAVRLVTLPLEVIRLVARRMRFV